MVAKLSSVRIMTAASLDTSVPVMPMATPMSAALRAGASFTPSPVMATTFPARLSSRTRRSLSSGATRATTPISGSCSSSCSSGMAANSAPVMARPSMPSSPAMAAAVAAWSPVIIRTRMPAVRHSAIAARASDLGASTIPTMANKVRSVTSPSRSPPGSKLLGSTSRWATTITRSPEAAMRSLASVARWRLAWVTAADAHHRPLRIPVGAPPRDQHVGGALDIAAHHRLALGAGHVVEGGHELVVGVEGDLGDPWVAGPGLLQVEPALGGQHDQGALGRIPDQAVAVQDRVRAQRHRQQVRVQVNVQPTDVADLPVGRVALARDGEPVLARDGQLPGGHLVEGERAGLVRADHR